MILYLQNRMLSSVQGIFTSDMKGLSPAGGGKQARKKHGKNILYDGQKFIGKRHDF